MYYEKFKVDNILYEFWVNDNFEISFAVLRGTSKKGSFSKNFDSDEYDDLDISISPFKVFSKVTELTLKWVRNNMPYKFSFHSTTDRKNKVYEHIIMKVFKTATDLVKNYHVYSDGKTHSFYRKTNEEV